MGAEQAVVLTDPPTSAGALGHVELSPVPLRIHLPLGSTLLRGGKAPQSHMPA